MSALAKGRGSLCSRTRSVAVLLASVAVLVFAAAPALADPFSAEMMVTGLIALIVVIPFSIATWFIEAAVLNYILKLDYSLAFTYSLVANLVSFFLGLIWASVLGESGWKAAFMFGQLDRMALLFLRSFVVTVAEEGLIILLLVGKGRDNKTTLGAVLAANAVSYAIGAPVMYVLRVR